MRAVAAQRTAPALADTVSAQAGPNRFNRAGPIIKNTDYFSNNLLGPEHTGYGPAYARCIPTNDGEAIMQSMAPKDEGRNYNDAEEYGDAEQLPDTIGTRAINGCSSLGRRHIVWNSANPDSGEHEQGCLQN